jgi:hypothetical protein
MLLGWGVDAQFLVPKFKMRFLKFGPFLMSSHFALASSPSFFVVASAAAS